MRLTTILALAAATMLAIPPLQAATSAISKGVTSVESSVTLTAGKKKKKAKAGKAKKATKVAAFKSCGTFMYRKDGKCLDARAKK